MNYDMSLHATMDGKTLDARHVKIGDIVTYLGHQIGGLVKIRFPDGVEDIAHPSWFKELQ